MNTALLVLLNTQLAVVITYCAKEWRSASHYRAEHLQVREDALVYDDLIARLQMRHGRGPIITRANSQRQAEHQNTDSNSELPHSDTSFQKVGT